MINQVNDNKKDQTNGKNDFNKCQFLGLFLRKMDS